MNRERTIGTLEAIRRRLEKEIDSALWYEVNEDIDTAIEALKAQEWIPCSERLPYAEFGESDTVIVTKRWRYDKKTKFVGLAMFNGGYWAKPTGECLVDREVIAWMPLPEPYREKDK